MVGTASSRVRYDIPPGLTSDDTTYSTLGRWEDARNIRFDDGRPEVIGGWTTLGADALTGVCRNILAWTDNSGTQNIAFGTHSALQVFIGGELFDITPTALPEGSINAAAGAGYGAGPYGEETYGTPRTLGGPRTWSLSTYGESLIACPLGETIYQWANDTITIAQPVANAPDRVTYALVTHERQLLAFGCNEEVSGEYNPLCIRGTDIEDITDWTTTTTNNAFEEILEGGGRIVCARLIGPYVAVWTDNALYIGQFVGSVGQAYRFDRVGENCGSVGPNAVTILGQTAFWVGPDYRFRAYRVGAPVEVLECPIWDDFADNLNTPQREKIVASSIEGRGEVWFYYPDARDGAENSREIILNVRNSWWSKAKIARTAAIDSGVVGYPVKCDVDGGVFYHESGQSANGGPIEWFIKSTDFYMGAAQQNMFVRGIWPDFEDQCGAVSLTVDVRQHPQGTPRSKGPFLLQPGQTKKDFRATGRIASMKFAGSSAPACAKIGSPAFDLVPTGGR